MVANSELEPDFKRMLAVWWLLAWRGTLVGALIGEIAGRRHRLRVVRDAVAG